MNAKQGFSFAARNFALTCLQALLAASTSQADQALVYSTDFSTGYYSRMATVPPYTPTLQVGLTCSDGAARSSGALTAIVGRFGCDYLQFLDTQNGFATTAQWSTGNGTNPQDFVTVSPTRIYVSLYERNYLLIMNPQTGQHLGQIDLSAFSDSDGIPEASSMVRVGDLAFVALQRLDRNNNFLPTNPSYVAVIDCNTDSIIDVDPQADGTQAIELLGRNPFDDLIYDPVRQKIAVANVGLFGVLDGGVEWVNPLTLQADGVFISELTLGGDLNRNRLYFECTGYAIINDANFYTKLVQYDHCSGTLMGTCRTTNGFTLSDLEIASDGVLFLAERDLIAPGVRLYQLPACNQITVMPVAFGLPPADILLSGACDSEVTDVVSLVPTALGLSANRPDPFNPATTFEVSSPAGQQVSVSVTDIRGRQVRQLWNGILQGTRRTLHWDGTDDRGRGVASGVYYAVVRTADGQGAGSQRTERMTLVR
jgi:hypothetical protein